MKKSKFLSNNEIKGNAGLATGAGKTAKNKPGNQRNLSSTQQKHYIPNYIQKANKKPAQKKWTLSGKQQKNWWAMTDSNRRHFACKANALTN